jgi:hypothetical protein
MCGGEIPIVSDLGSGLEDIGQYASSVLASQEKEVRDDPVKFAIKAAAIASGHPELIPVIEAVDTYEEGGTVEESLISGGKSYAGQQIGAEISGGGEFASTGEDFDMGGGGYNTGEDFNMGGGFTTTGEDFNMGGGQFASTGEDFNMGDGGGAPITDYSREVTLTPGGNAVPATTLPSEMAGIDAEIEAAAKALPSRISPMLALQGLRAASGLLGGRQQPQQQQRIPQMQMGARTQIPQGEVDYSGIYNLLALQRAKNPNSLLG